MKKPKIAPRKFFYTEDGIVWHQYECYQPPKAFSHFYEVVEVWPDGYGRIFPSGGVKTKDEMLLLHLKIEN